MAIHWTYRSLPEFRNVAPELRDQVWARCIERSQVKRSEWAVYGVIIFVFAGVKAFSFRWLGIEQDELMSFITMFAAIVVPLVIWQQMVLRRGRAFIEDEMPGHCRGCGYNLCGLVTDCCPECGTAIINPANAEDAAGKSEIS